jgi:hypothetical protein
VFWEMPPTRFENITIRRTQDAYKEVTSADIL